MAAELDVVGEPRVAEQHRDVDLLHLAARLAGDRDRRIGGQQDAARHHAEILVAIRDALGAAVVADVAEAGLFQEPRDTFARIEALGVELVGDHALLVVDDDFARDQALAVGRDRALAAHEMVLVDPLPRAALEVLGHVGAVGDIEHDLARGTQHLADRRQHLLVVLLVGEVAERVAHDGDAVEARLREPRVAGIAFLEHDAQRFGLGALAGEPDEVARAVDTHHVLEPAPGEFQHVPALAAAQVEDGAVRLDGGGGDQEIHLAARVLAVLDDVAVGLDVERVEQLAPPLRRQVLLEIGDRPEGGAGGRTAGLLRLGTGKVGHGWHAFENRPFCGDDRAPTFGLPHCRTFHLDEPKVDAVTRTASTRGSI